MAKMSRAQARELKHQGLQGVGVSRGRAAPAELAAEALAHFFADEHIRFEEAMARLRKLSPHHAKKVRDEILDITENY